MYCTRSRRQQGKKVCAREGERDYGRELKSDGRSENESLAGDSVSEGGDIETLLFDSGAATHAAEHDQLAAAGHERVENGILRGVDIGLDDRPRGRPHRHHFGDVERVDAHRIARQHEVGRPMMLRLGRRTVESKAGRASRRPSRLRRRLARVRSRSRLNILFHTS